MRVLRGEIYAEPITGADNYGCHVSCWAGDAPAVAAARFNVRQPMEDDDNSNFIPEGDFEIDEADRLLPRLKNDGIRFEIEMIDVPRGAAPGFSRLTSHFSRVRIYIHKLDLEAWTKIREKLYPV